MGYEPFETESGWIIETDTSGVGSTVARSNEQAYAGSYSGKCFTTNSGAKAQVRDVIASHWDDVPSADPGEFIWQRARIFIPTATADALTGAEYLDLAGFYVSSSASGWYLRLGASAVLQAVGPYGGTQYAFTLYDTLPINQWVELEIGLWSQTIEAGGRSFIVFVNGDVYGWYRLGSKNTDYDRVAMGILATNSNDDLTVYVDNWYIYTTGTDPVGTDNRLISDPTTIDFTDQSGHNIDIQYATWKDAGTTWQDATNGVGGVRFQCGPNSDKQRANLESGWAEIVLDWIDGTEPAWPPDVLWGTYFFANMVAFKKYCPDEENLEIVILYNWDSSGTAELAYEAWGDSQVVYKLWELPEATSEAGAHFPEPGDKIRVHWEEVSATNLAVNVDYYDVSTNTWYWDCIVDSRNMSNQAGVNWLDHIHNQIEVTLETTKYSVRSIRYGTLGTDTTSSSTSSSTTSSSTSSSTTSSSTSSSTTSSSSSTTSSSTTSSSTSSSTTSSSTTSSSTSSSTTSSSTSSSTTSSSTTSSSTTTSSTTSSSTTSSSTTSSSSTSSSSSSTTSSSTTSSSTTSSSTTSSSTTSSSTTSSSTTSSSTSSSTTSSSSISYVIPPCLGEYAFGEQNPLAGEYPRSWQTWSDGAASVPTIIGDVNWGQVELGAGEEARSAVYDLGTDNNRMLTIEENRYGSGSGSATLQIRGDVNPFVQDSGEPPNWETYTVPIYKTWRYVQVRAIKSA